MALIQKAMLINIADWLLPPNIFRLLTYYRPSAVYFYLKNITLLSGNRALYNRHVGQRCFILASGPSVKEQNILPLKNEIVFGLSSGYLYRDYPKIAPIYHCVPQITDFAEEVTVERFKEMHEKIGNAELFLAHQEMHIVKKYDLFKGRKLHYLCMGTQYFAKNPRKIPPFDGIIPRVQSVPIMALIIALNMGFKEIYLVGVDHDWLLKKQYKHCFEHTVLKGQEAAIKEDGTLVDGNLEQFPVAIKLWSQYRAIRNLAHHCGAKIYNANPKSMLDEFELVHLEDVLKT